MKATPTTRLATALVCFLAFAADTACLAQAAPGSVVLQEHSPAAYPVGAVVAFDKDRPGEGYRVVPWYGAGTHVRILGADAHRVLYRRFDGDASAYAVKEDSGTHLYLYNGGSRVGPALQQLGPGRDQVAFAVSDEQSGLISVQTGEWVLSPEDFRGVGFPIGGRVVCWKDGGRWGIYDLEGNQIGVDFTFPLDPETHRPAFTSDCIAINVDDSILIINRDAEAVTETKGHVVGRFVSGLARATPGGERGLVGYIDTAGEWVVDPAYGSAGDFREGLAPVSLDSIYSAAFDGTISRNSSISPRKAEELLKDEKSRWGFIDRSGDLVIPMIFERVQYFSEGLAAVRIDGKWGYINREGTVVIPPVYSTAGLFQNGLAYVVLSEAGSDRPLLIDAEGDIVAEY